MTGGLSERLVCLAGFASRGSGRELMQRAGSGGYFLVRAGALALLLAGFCASSAAAVTVLHVDAVHGSDSGNCESSACRTLAYSVGQAALDSGGVTISAAPGEYQEDLALSSSVDGLTITGAGSGTDPSTSTIITGVAGVGAIETGTMSALALEHLRVVDPPSVARTVINAPQANLTLTDVAIDQQANEGEGLNLVSGSVTMNGGSVSVDGAQSNGYAIESGTSHAGGEVALTGTAVTVNGHGYAINAWGMVTASSATIDVTNSSASGYAINTEQDVSLSHTTLDVAGEGYGVNTRGSVGVSGGTIDLTNPLGTGFAINAEGAIVITEATIDVAGYGFGVNTDGDVTVTGSTITLPRSEGFTGFGVNARGRVSVSASHITVAGEGYGVNCEGEMLLENSTIDLTDHTGGGWGANTSGALRAIGSEINVAGEGDGAESGGPMTLENTRVEVMNTRRRNSGLAARDGAKLSKVAVTVAGRGSALTTVGSATIEDSTLTSGPGASKPAFISEGVPDHDTVVVRRSTIRDETRTQPTIEAEAVNLVLEDSLLLEGSGVAFAAVGGETYTLTVASSTIDAATPGVRDEKVNSIRAVAYGGSTSLAEVHIEGSILVEPPAIVLHQISLPTVRTASAAGPPGPDTVERAVAVLNENGEVKIDCSYTEVPEANEIQPGANGAIDCATGKDGNTYTPSLDAIFAKPGTSYTLNPSWEGVDSIPDGAITLPEGLTTSSTDLAGDPRVLNGSGNCLPPKQDKGALELTGHEGVLPAPAIAAPESFIAGETATFTATAPNVPGTTFAWQSSDGSEGTGATFEHTFETAASYTVTLTATGRQACTATIDRTIAVKPPPEGEPAPKPQIQAPVSPASPAPPAPPAAQLALVCANRRLTLTDVVMRSDHVLLTGAAEGDMIGQTVTIVFDGREQVATAKVGRDGLFATTAPLPPANLRYSNSARYQAQIGKLRSLDLKLTRRLVLDPPTSHRGRVTLAGEILPPLMSPRAKILVSLEGSNCTHPRVLTELEPSASGHYAITLPDPVARGVAVYRLSSFVRADARSSHPFKTFSLTETVKLK